MIWDETGHLLVLCLNPFFDATFFTTQPYAVCAFFFYPSFHQKYTVVVRVLLYNLNRETVVSKLYLQMTLYSISVRKLC